MNPNHIFLLAALLLFTGLVAMLIHVRRKNKLKPQQDASGAKRQWLLGAPLLAVSLVWMWNTVSGFTAQQGGDSVAATHNIGVLLGSCLMPLLLLLVALRLLKKKV